MTEVLWDANTAQIATLGQSKSFWTATGISFDSRKINKGDLFIALPGKRDGHDFVKYAFERGAVAVMVTKVPRDIDMENNLLFVDDVMKALIRMAKISREKSKAIFIGITGTSGKTSTKDMGSMLFKNFGKTHYSEKSYNNILGCSLTLATIPRNTEFVLVEIGTNSLGEISELSQLVKPDYVVITDVSEGHLEGLKSLDNIVEEKASICFGQKQGGLAIIPTGIKKFEELKVKVEGFGSRVISFGEKENSDVRILNTEVKDTCIFSTISDQEENIWSFTLNTVGAHHARNTTALLALSVSLKLSITSAISALGYWTPLPGRGQVMPINFKNSGNDIYIDLIDESYNANPASIKSSLDTLAQIFDATTGRPRRSRIAVLGDMLELGKKEIEEHVKISKFPKLDNIDKIYCVGSRMKELFNVLPVSKKGLWTETAEEMKDVLVKKLKNGDIVMIKGSFSMRMNKIVSKLKNLNK